MAFGMGGGRFQREATLATGKFSEPKGGAWVAPSFGYFLVVKKSERIEAFVGTLGSGTTDALHPCYLGYFECFNSGHYYEAHDVLEHLWLQQGRAAPDYAYYKGLIQLAGGFVHLRLHYLNPDHPKHGRRLAPARRLFLLAAVNLTPYAPLHLGLELEHPVSLARNMAVRLETESGINPWSPETAPLLPLPEIGR
jgi:hypothetical protein